MNTRLCFGTCSSHYNRHDNFDWPHSIAINIKIKSDMSLTFWSQERFQLNDGYVESGVDLGNEVGTGYHYDCKFFLKLGPNLETWAAHTHPKIPEYPLPRPWRGSSCHAFFALIPLFTRWLWLTVITFPNAKMYKYVFICLMLRARLFVWLSYRDLAKIASVTAD